MRIIGLVGGIASGKSTVAAELERLGATILDADAAAHETINRRDVIAALTDRWGQSILDKAGKIDRRAVAEKVFAGGTAGRQELDFLESIIHPLIRADFQRQLPQLAASGCHAAVIDAPLLLEAGWAEMCDEVLFVESPPAKRCSRTKTRNWTDDEFGMREAAQMSIEEKRRKATHVIENSGSLADLREKVEQYWQQTR